MAQLTLGIDGWRLLGQRTGVGRYVQELIRHWDSASIGSHFSDAVLYTPRPLGGDVEVPSAIRTRVLWPDARMLVWDNIAFGPRARHDVVFFPSFSRPLVTRGRTVVTIHEATYRLHPGLHPRRGRLSTARLYLGLYGWSGRNATCVIASSHAAADDIAAGYRVPRERIRVVPLAPADIFRQVVDESAVAETRSRHLGDDVPFFLHVGKLSPVRNVPAVIEAFARAKRDHRLPHRLLLVGTNELGTDLGALVRAGGAAGDCVHAGFVPDDELVHLYSAATAFVLPYAY